jgi:putative intracellular protease/amidase
MTQPRILIVLTSHDQMGNTGNKTGFWLEELASPYYVFVDAGAEVTLASIRGGLPPVDPKSHLPESETEMTRRFKADVEANKKLQNTIAITEVDAGDYDAIFLPGGHGTMWDFPESTTLTNLIEAFDEEEKVIAAVCHAPAALVNVKTSSGVLRYAQRTISSYQTLHQTGVQSKIIFR